jgi:hypothetical protein
LEVLDARRALAELGGELGHVVGQGDGAGEPARFRPGAGELGLQSGAAAPGRWGGDALTVERARNRLETVAIEVLGEDSPDDRGLLRVDDGNRVAPTGWIRTPIQTESTASTARDATFADARAQRLAGPLPDRLELHLVPGVLDEGRREQLALVVPDLRVVPLHPLRDVTGFRGHHRRPTWTSSLPWLSRVQG